MLLSGGDVTGVSCLSLLRTKMYSRRAIRSALRADLRLALYLLFLILAAQTLLVGGPPFMQSRALVVAPT